MLASLFVDTFRFIGDNPGLLLHKAEETAELAFTALGIGLAIALPIGLWLGHRHQGLTIALGVSTFARALPSVVLLGLGIAILGVGFRNLTVALVVLAVPPLLTNSYVAVEGADRDAVEAGRGMGLTETQILARVELPLGLPFILAGIRIAAVFVIATATLAGIFGGGGLGDIMANQVEYGLDGVLAAALCVAALALLTAAALGVAQRAAFRRMAPSA